MKAWVYILQFENNGRFYVGSTTNLERRIMQHSSGQTSSTRSRGPFRLVFKQAFANSKTAHQVERKIKSWKRRDFIENIIRDGKITSVVVDE